MSYLSPRHRYRVPLGRATAAAVATALAATAVVLTGASAEAAPTSSTTLVVNAAQNLRSVTHVGTGSLYGLAGASTSDSLVQPLKPNTFIQMAPGGDQLPTASPLRRATPSLSPPRPRPRAPRSSYGCRTGIRTSPTSG